MRPLRTSAAAVAAVLLLGSIPVGIAGADCSGAGDFGAGSGCPPPGDTSGSGGGGESWPPTGVDWPPAQSADSGGGGGDDTSTPIVLPDGRQAPTHPAKTTDSPSTSTAPTPIVPVGAPVVAATPGVIVTAN